MRGCRCHHGLGLLSTIMTLSLQGGLPYCTENWCLCACECVCVRRNMYLGGGGDEQKVYVATLIMYAFFYS